MKKKIEQSGEKWHLSGDATYPIRVWLLTPFRDYANLTPKQTICNYRLSSARVKIENAFGLLKQRFRQLQRLEFLRVLNTSRFIIACCVLHNLCIMNNDLWESVTEIEDEIVPVELNDDDAARQPGEVKRIRIQAYI
ncbi:hypothetical protein NQ314_001667 [Rhamnusium bicolor]|uniref:DDE Tnp4 domain-containing protein n=1 Tax=Rhamnusium bicolor TaxID=1586634 RepID=A0AAV8ZRM3_9CUCU|nr:hypothetical protein NQ314_001667 [Rhamnusium bicolor]